MANRFGKVHQKTYVQVFDQGLLWFVCVLGIESGVSEQELSNVKKERRYWKEKVYRECLLQLINCVGFHWSNSTFKARG